MFKPFQKADIAEPSHLNTKRFAQMLQQNKRNRRVVGERAFTCSR